MVDPYEKVERLSEELQASRRVIFALGDEERFNLMLTMMRMRRCEGVRAADIAEISELSRPAISHHLQILKDAGIVCSRKEGTKVYYYFDREMKALSDLKGALDLVIEIVGSLPECPSQSDGGQEERPGTEGLHGDSDTRDISDGPSREAERC